MRWDEAMGKPRPVGAYANQRLTPAAAGKTHGGQAKVPNRTREIRPSGIIGGPRETWLYAGAPELYPNGAADKAASLAGRKSPRHQLPVFGWLAYPMHAEATTHVLLGRKSLGCPAAISRSGRNGLGGEQT